MGSHFLTRSRESDGSSEHLRHFRTIDDANCRRLDRTTGSGPARGGGTEGVYRHTYHSITDAQYNTVSLLDDSDGIVLERVTSRPYGVARHHWAGDLDGDGAVTSADQAIGVAAGDSKVGDPAYNVDADLNRDGVVTSDDFPPAPILRAALRSGFISNPDPASGPDNPIGYAGYVFNPEALLSPVQFRRYDEGTGRWRWREWVRLALDPPK